MKEEKKVSERDLRSSARERNAFERMKNASIREKQT